METLEITKKSYIIFLSILFGLGGFAIGIVTAFIVVIIIEALAGGINNTFGLSLIGLGSVIGVIGGIVYAFNQRKTHIEHLKTHSRISCETCGSEDVRFNADAVWDAPRQQFDIIAVFQNVTCEDCGVETSIQEEPLYPELHK